MIGGGNTAMDCCRTALRLGAKNVKVVLRTPIEPWSPRPGKSRIRRPKGFPILENHNPLEYIVEDGKLKAMKFEIIEYSVDDRRHRSLHPGRAGRKPSTATLVLLAIGQANAFPWIERDIGIEFNKIGLAVVDDETFQSTHPKVFFGGDAAFGPKNIITAVAQGHQAALSIDLFLKGQDLTDQRRDPGTNLISQKMGIHEWSYASMVTEEERHVVPHVDLDEAIHSHKLEVELGFDAKTALEEAQRCLNCDVETVFTADKCIECDACIDICPVDCLTFTENDEEAELRRKPQCAGPQSLPGHLCFEEPSNRPGDGEGRGCLPALRPVRGALPHRRVGHAEVPLHRPKAVAETNAKFELKLEPDLDGNSLKPNNVIIPL